MSKFLSGKDLIYGFFFFLLARRHFKLFEMVLSVLPRFPQFANNQWSMCVGLSMSGLGLDLLLLSQFLSGLSDPRCSPIPEFLSVLDPT